MGVVVLIVAVVALHDPRSDSQPEAGQSVVTPPASTPSPSQTSSTVRTPAPKTSGSTSAPTSAPTSVSGSGSTAASPGDPKSIPLVVLNNTTISGLAKQAAQRFEGGGWTVTSTGNLTNDIISTCAYYDPNTTGAKAAATALQAQFPTIQRVQPKFAGLPSGPVVVVLTPDYSSD